jgi:hypothetical protein
MVCYLAFSEDSILYRTSLQNIVLKRLDLSGAKCREVKEVIFVCVFTVVGLVAHKFRRHGFVTLPPTASEVFLGIR